MRSINCTTRACERSREGRSPRDRAPSRRSLLTKAGAGGALLSLGALAGPVSQFMPAALPPRSSTTRRSSTVRGRPRVRGSRRRTKRHPRLGHAQRERGEVGQDVPGAPSSITAGRSTTHRSAGRRRRSPTPRVARRFYNPKLKAATDQKALLEIAYSIEEAAAATYLSALGLLQDKSNAESSATILPVESQHAVVLGQILNKAVTDYMPPFQNDLAGLGPGRVLGLTRIRIEENRWISTVTSSAASCKAVDAENTRSDEAVARGAHADLRRR